MLVEPELDRAVLAAVLRREYGLVAGAVRFIPAGETAWCYELTDEHGGWWFCKLSRAGAIEHTRAEFALQVAGALAGLGVPVPRPLPTRAGTLWCWLDGLRVAVFEFVDVAPLSDQDLRAPGVARQADQYQTSVRACVALARVFLADGYDVALETVFEPDDFNQRWRPLLADLAWHLVVLRPSLSVTLARSRSRTKRVLEEHTTIQHERTGGWSANVQIDTTDLSVEHTLEIINNHLGSDPHLVDEV